MFNGKTYILLKMPFSAEKCNMQQPLDKTKLNTDLWSLNAAESIIISL